ncbi:MAG: uncharacterized protein A8A55_1570 [Amphiamblys sp. WSBS2006]|nr:MAG: uncharacterized protein A8A55_1570 [Amphiamblys sp. WSBS2006]
MDKCDGRKEHEKTPAAVSGGDSAQEAQRVHANTEAPGVLGSGQEQLSPEEAQEQERIANLSKKIVYDTQDNDTLLRKYPEIKNQDIQKHMLKRRFKMHSTATPLEDTGKDAAVLETAAADKEKIKHIIGARDLTKKRDFLNGNTARFMQTEKTRKEAERVEREKAEALEAEANEKKQREEAEKKQREEAEKKQREEAERKQREEAEALRQREEAERKRQEAEAEEKRLRDERRASCEAARVRFEELRVLKRKQEEEVKARAAEMLKSDLEFEALVREMRSKKECLRKEINRLNCTLEEKGQTASSDELAALGEKLAECEQQHGVFSEKLKVLDDEEKKREDSVLWRHLDTYLVKGTGLATYPEEIDKAKGRGWKKGENVGYSPLFVLQLSKLHSVNNLVPIDLSVYVVRGDDLRENLHRFKKYGNPAMKPRHHDQPQQPTRFMFKQPATEGERIHRQVTSLLNRLAQANIPIIYEKVYELGIPDEKKFDLIAAPLIDGLFDKAVNEEGYVGVYAELCRMLCFEEVIRIQQGSGRVSEEAAKDIMGKFRKILLEKVQKEYTEKKRWKELGDGKEEIDFVKLHHMKKELRDRILGNLVFIAQLFQYKLLSKRVIFNIVEELFSNIDNADADDIKCLTTFMTNIGETLEFGESCETTTMKKYYEKLEATMAHLYATEGRKTHVYYMILELVEKRKLWVAGHTRLLKEKQAEEWKPAPQRRKRGAASTGVKTYTTKASQRNTAYVPKRPEEEPTRQASVPRPGVAPAPTKETTGPGEGGMSAVIEEGIRETSAELKEYYASGDPESMVVAFAGLSEKGFPKEKFVDVSVYKGVETGKERCRAKTSLMVNVLLEEKLLETADVVKGFLCTARSIPELKQDVPYAVRYFKEIAGGVSVHGEIMEALEQGEKELWSELSR